jgi:sialate O-acetylesterase
MSPLYLQAFAFANLFVLCSSTLSLSATVSNSMVLQRDVPLSSLWGYSTPGSIVTATLSSSGNSYPSSETGSDGIFRVVLPSLPTTSIPFNVTFSSPGENNITISDIVVGDVILCSGQSNMQVSLQMAFNATAEIAATNAFGSMIRVMYVGGRNSLNPEIDIITSIPWSRASAASMGGDSWGGFSAQCWYTGRSIYQLLNETVPIGLIESCVGGTAIRNWVSTQALSLCPQPYTPGYGETPYTHSQLFNGMIAGFGTGPTALKMVLWDQAESDSFPQTPPEYYGCQTIAQINDWRSLFQNIQLPWIFIHLQPYVAGILETLRSSQLNALLLPMTGYATAMDLGDDSSPLGAVHFRNKQTSGFRAALAALSVAYNDPFSSSPYPPPTFLRQIAYFDNSSSVASIDVFFSTGQPLVLLPPNSTSCPTDIGEINCASFQILGSDGNIYPANATLSTNIITITAQLPTNGTYGVGSAYAWIEWPNVLLYSGGDGGASDLTSLPVLPWRQGLSIPTMPGPRPPSKV